MRPAVLKFGGAGLRDGEAIRHAAEIVAGTAGARVVVASALEGVTDLLLAAQDKVRGDDAQVLPFLEAVRRRHERALAEAAPGDEAARYALHAGLQRLERLLYGIAYTEEHTPRLHDLVQSFGERLSAPLLAAAVRARGHDAVALDAEHAGLRTQGPFGDAQVDLDAVRRETGAVLSPMLERGVVPVLTGYYGVDADGNATLFGRGGSDFVATLVGYAVEAERVELWKDVPGFMTADPRIVPAARLVAELGYDEAAELAQVGAKVLHPRSVEPAQAVGIPIYVRSLKDPRHAGTVIRDGAATAPGHVRGMTARQPVAVVRVTGRPAAALDDIHRAGVRVHAACLGGSGVAVAVDEADAAPLRHALDPRHRAVEVLPGRSLICVVGRGLGAAPGQAAKVLQAVTQAGAHVEMATLGGSPTTLAFAVAAAQATPALRALHATFVEGK